MFCHPWHWIPALPAGMTRKRCDSPLAGYPLMRFAAEVGVILRRPTALTTSYILAGCRRWAGGNQIGRSHPKKAWASQRAGKPAPTGSSAGKTNPETVWFQED